MLCAFSLHRAASILVFCTVPIVSKGGLENQIPVQGRRYLQWNVWGGADIRDVIMQSESGPFDSQNWFYVL